MTEITMLVASHKATGFPWPWTSQRVSRITAHTAGRPAAAKANFVVNGSIGISGASISTAITGAAAAGLPATSAPGCQVIARPLSLSLRNG